MGQVAVLDIRHEERSSLLPELFRTIGTPGGQDTTNTAITSFNSKGGALAIENNLADASQQSFTERSRVAPTGIDRRMRAVRPDETDLISVALLSLDNDTEDAE